MLLYWPHENKLSKFYEKIFTCSSFPCWKVSTPTSHSIPWVPTRRLKLSTYPWHSSQFKMGRPSLDGPCRTSSRTSLVCWTSLPWWVLERASWCLLCSGYLPREPSSYSRFCMGFSQADVSIHLLVDSSPLVRFCSASSPVPPCTRCGIAIPWHERDWVSLGFTFPVINFPQ